MIIFVETKIMTSERIKEIQETTAYPESLSVMLALKQVWNECEQSQPSIVGDVKVRFFFFTFSYWYGKSVGEGNFSFKSKFGFPTQKDIKKTAIEQVMNKYGELEHKVLVVIKSWIEMSEDDYNNWGS